MKKLISVVIINWNGEKYLERCIESILNQSYTNIETILIDNGSTDNSVKVVKTRFGDKVNIIENENLGYAGGANKGIITSNGQYVLIANPDVIFDELYIELCLETMNKQNKTAAVMGKLLKYDFDTNTKLKVIDSAGISLNHSRKGIDRGQNEKDVGQFDKEERVFGVCGAAAIFDKEILDIIKINEDFFDSDFFAYKEDIDLCWRLNLYGFECIYDPNALAYHGRGMNSAKGIIETIKNRKKQSEFLKGISFRNHYFMIIKNEVASSFKKDKIKIYLDLIKYLLFFLLFDFKCLKYTKELIRNKSTMIAKRNIIMDNKKIDDEEIYKLFDL